MTKGFLLLCCASLAGASALATIVSGKIYDQNGAPLPGVAVKLVSIPDSTQSTFSFSDENGKYQIPNTHSGKYRLILAMTGMDDVEKYLEIPDSIEDFSVKDITMSENSVTLQETVVTAVRAAVIAKEDTLEFNAGSFHTNPNASVEDLLKKLPGVEVGSDGSITSGGKTVSKILVDGKEFFADDPKMATKNLPSDMVDKVQVIDRKSETARLTGVDDGEDETVINLSVKKDMNNGWFGNVSAGYGTDHRFQANATVNWFRNGNQLTILAGGNNINEQGFTDQGRGRFHDFGGNNGINTTQQFGINFNVGNEEKFRIGGNLLYTHNDRDARSRFDTQYLFPDSVSYLRGGSRTRDRGHSIRAQFRMKWNISEADVLDFRPEFSLNLRKSELQDSSILRSSLDEADRVNSNLALRTNRGTDYSLSGRLIYTHKFLSHPGRSISAQANYEFSDTKQKQTTWNDIEYYLRQDDSERLFQFLDSRQWGNRIEGRLTWTEPIGDASRGNSLEFAYKASMRWSNADKLTYDLPMSEGFDPLLSGFPDYSSTPYGAILDPDLSNRFRNRFSNQELQIGFKRNVSKYNLNVGLTFSPSSTESEDLINSARNIDRRWVWNVAPYLRFKYKFSKNSSLHLRYSARTSQPTIAQLQPVADVSDPLNITVGNPDLKPTFTQSLGLHYNRYNNEKQQSLFAAANASYSLNNVVARTLTDSQTGVRTTTYSNSNGNWNVFAMAMINQPLHNRKWRFFARLQTRFSSAAGYINGDYNRSGDLQLSPNAGMTFSCDVFQMSVEPTYSFSMATSTLQQQANRYTHLYGFRTDASVYLPFGLELGTDLAFTKSTGYSSGFDNMQWIWNAQLSYSCLSDKSLTFSVRASDLLGQRKNVNRTVNANMITDREYNDLGRYIMFGVTWKFNTLKKKARANAPGDFPGDRPDGPPDGDRGPGGRPDGERGERPMGPPPGGFGPR